MSDKTSESPTGFTYIPPSNGTDIPLIIDSPHSGRDYPADFDYDCDLHKLRRLEDLYVDQLTADLHTHGAHLLNANFPRSYIDPSRPRDCLDPKQIKGGLKNLPYNRDGLYRKFLKNSTGLIFMKSVISGFEIYHKHNKPTEKDIGLRLPLWDAYHTKLNALFNDLAQTHGQVYLIDMHSCWRHGAQKALGLRSTRPDVVLSDNNGITCSTDFLQAAKEAFKAEGLRVKVNKPFKGGYIVNHYGQPDSNRHSLQVEVARDLYLNEETLKPHGGMKDLQQAMSNVTAKLADFIKSEKVTETLTR